MPKYRVVLKGIKDDTKEGKKAFIKRLAKTRKITPESAQEKIKRSKGALYSSDDIGKAEKAKVFIERIGGIAEIQVMEEAHAEPKAESYTIVSAKISHLIKSILEKSRSRHSSYADWISYLLEEALKTIGVEFEKALKDMGIDLAWEENGEEPVRLPWERELELSPPEAVRAIKSVGQAGLITSPIQEYLRLPGGSVAITSKVKTPIYKSLLRLVFLPLWCIKFLAYYIPLEMNAWIDRMMLSLVIIPTCGAGILCRLFPALKKPIVKICHNRNDSKGDLAFSMICITILYPTFSTLGFCALFLSLFRILIRFKLESIFMVSDWALVTEEHFIFYQGMGGGSISISKKQPSFEKKPLFNLRRKHRAFFVTSCSASDGVESCTVCLVSLPQDWAEKYELFHTHPPEGEEFWAFVRNEAGVPST